jgi:hypothetical protein
MNLIVWLPAIFALDLFSIVVCLAFTEGRAGVIPTIIVASRGGTKARRRERTRIREFSCDLTRNRDCMCALWCPRSLVRHLSLPSDTRPLDL